jgi:hypothetical protein
MSIVGIGGAGIPLPYPSNNYGYAPFGGTNDITLPAGGTYLIPAGTWWITPGIYTFIQALDPITGIWQNVSQSGNYSPQQLNSDGANWRLANLTGTVVGAIMTNNGTGYSASSPPTVTVSAGGSKWTAVVGGAVASTTVVTAGANYSLIPSVFFSAPPAGGVQATGYAVLSGGTLSSITMVNPGAGYTSAPAIVVVPNAMEPNNVTTATATASIASSAGTVTALLCTNNGAVVSSLPTLTIAAPTSGTTATATAIGCFTTTSLATSGTAGAGYGTSLTYQAAVIGGANASTPATYNNPSVSTKIFNPRPANAGVIASSAGGAIANTTLSIVDGGLFQVFSTPTPVLFGNPISTPSTVVTFTTVIGGVSDTSFITPLL